MMRTDTVTLDLDGAVINGDLALPDAPAGLVVFAHGTGSSRHSPRNRAVAAHLGDAGFGTLLLDLLTDQEERVDAETREPRFDIGLLGERVTSALDWLSARPRLDGLATGLFGASTGAAGALVAASRRADRVAAVVSRGGRPDLAGAALGEVTAPTLLIVGGNDEPVVELNRRAAAGLARGELRIIPGATHLFPEPGALEGVAELAAEWFRRHLANAG